MVSVSEDHLPGALVLLQESGYSQLVLDLGTQWLTVNKQDVRRRDVTAAMAQAHHTLAVQGLQQEAWCMLESCRHLESALLLIRQSLRGSEHAAVASDLQRDVMQLLKVGLLLIFTATLSHPPDRGCISATRAPYCPVTYLHSSG